jgi:arsenate reductase
MPKAVKTLYWLPYCSTCTKAEAFLLEAGCSIAERVNLKEDPVSEATLKALAEGVGGVEKLFSKRAMKYRSMGLHEKELSEADMLGYMQEEYTFIKRPVVLFEDGTTLAGFSKKAYETTLKA